VQYAYVTPAVQFLLPSDDVIQHDPVGATHDVKQSISEEYAPEGFLIHE
jgi:hypothetical protein